MSRHIPVGEHQVPYQVDRPTPGREAASCLRAIERFGSCPSCTKKGCQYSGRLLEILQATRRRAA